MSKTAAIFTTSEGHESIAEAVREALQKNYKTKLFFEDIPLAKAYTTLYQFFPSLNQIPFKAMTSNKTTESAHKIMRLKYQKKINQFFNKYRPDVLINTYGIYNSCLEDLQNLTQIPFINVLADPKTPQPIGISPNAKVNLTFDDKTQKYCRQYYQKAKYKNSGWFVRNRFETDYDQTKVRKELNLNPQTLTLLVASGSEGTNLVMKVLPTLIKSPQPVQVIIACGNNKGLFESIKTLKLFLNDEKGNYNQLIPLKFTNKIHQYMQAADLVIGKAGPNTLFETVATETPFFAITHIAGQEDGNLEIIHDYQLGYVEENMIKAQKLLKTIIKNPQQLTKFKPYIQKLKQYNQHSKEILRQTVAKVI